MPRLAKLSSKNQLTLPKAVLQAYPDVEYFAVSVSDGGILLKPFAASERPSVTEEVRDHIKRLGLGPQDVKAAVRWARKQKAAR